MNGSFTVADYQYRVPLSSRSDKGVSIWEVAYYVENDSSFSMYRVKKIVDGSLYYRWKYLQNRKKWVTDNESVFEVVERSAYRLVYKVKADSVLISLHLKNGRVTEVWECQSGYSID